MTDTTTRVLVQGGGRGLGLAFVERLLADPAARVIATARKPNRYPRLEQLAEQYGRARLRVVALDIGDEASIADARRQTQGHTDRLDLMLTCAGLLHDQSHDLWPEKRLADIRGDDLARSFAINATGPLLMVKHFHDLLTHGERAVIASLSARVGSIDDNRIGGWYAYRAAKAAQNQFTRTAAIELRRRAKALICVGLHPGTVDTNLSAPFQKRVPAKQLRSADDAAKRLLAVIAGLGPRDSGRIFDWAGEEIQP